MPAGNPMAELAPGLGSRRGRASSASWPASSSSRTPVVRRARRLPRHRRPAVLGGVAALLQHPPRAAAAGHRSPAPIPRCPLHRLRMSDDALRDPVPGPRLRRSRRGRHARRGRRGRRRRTTSSCCSRRTEGWPAGMRLAALFLRRATRPRDPASFAGDDQAVTDYLVGEVLASQPPDMQRFLLRTSDRGTAEQRARRGPHRRVAQASTTSRRWRARTRSSSGSDPAGSGSATTRCCARCCGTGCGSRIRGAPGPAPTGRALVRRQRPPDRGDAARRRRRRTGTLLGRIFVTRGSGARRVGGPRGRRARTAPHPP